MGVKQAGHEVVAAIDIEPLACETYTANNNIEPHCGDIRGFSGQDLLNKYGIEKGDIDIVVGCPPCQGFSTLRRTRIYDGKDPRNDLVGVYLERIKELDPQAVVFENVIGILWGKGPEYLNPLVDAITKMGYKVNSEIVVNTADYGVPQHRRRVVIFGVRDMDEPPTLPPKTHADPRLNSKQLPPWNTVRSAIGDLPPLLPGESYPAIPNHNAHRHSPRVQKMIEKIPKNGGSWTSLPEDMWLPCHKKMKEKVVVNVYGRMRWDEPSNTITCRCTTPSSGRFLHPEQDRAITCREAARLQTFPDSFIFPNLFGPTERLIGNAVPPLLMKNIITYLVKLL